MARLPVLKPREIAHVLEKRGFVEVRQRGSHKQYRHADGRCTTVPFHGNRDASPFLLRQLSPRELAELATFIRDCRFGLP
jgi:predicted RNA binding protein YcfA (HicA-like mRNA interferase family)